MAKPTKSPNGLNDLPVGTPVVILLGIRFPKEVKVTITKVQNRKGYYTVTEVEGDKATYFMHPDQIVKLS